MKNVHNVDQTPSTLMQLLPARANVNLIMLVIILTWVVAQQDVFLILTVHLILHA